MDEKARFRRFAYGMVATIVLTVIAGIFFGSIGVTLALTVGLGATLLAGGGLGGKS
ncbi:hypothetical protein [Falsiroseomonas oryzae]|uniref:hypothetical protein n=1 Tax=Falsiroseomonas oryzae TaxID=2766473 RepID=UPI0022EAB87E|nr:hypothetical protein [Roseomonas sp. MO-31]